MKELIRYIGIICTVVVIALLTGMCKQPWWFQFVYTFPMVMLLYNNNKKMIKVMKANEAPEKLYLSKNIYSTYMYQVPDPDDESCVEYVFTDTFIEKACEWLEEHMIGWNNDFVKDFRNYMKG